MKNQDDLPLYRPKMGGRTRTEQSRFPGSSMKRVASSARGGYVKRGNRPAHVKPPSGSSRRVVVKARVVRMSAYGKKAAMLHERYLQRDRVGKEGAEGQFYGRQEQVASQTFEPGAQGEAHQFRFIVSPADAHELELTGFTRELMGQVEKDLGRELHWKAVNHYNTDNPHVHVVVRGVDRQGRELRIDPDYISSGIRYRAQEIVTRELGVQPQWEAEHFLAQELGRERLTSFDARLATLEQGGRVELGAYPDAAGERIAIGRLQGRLQVLERLGLAAQDGARRWSMQEGWQESLREMGERSRIFQEIHREVGGDPSRYRIFDAAVHGGGVSGRLAAKGLADELGDRYYAIVETHQGRAFYVELDRGSSPDAVTNGEIVSVTAERDPWLKPADLIIAEEAERNHGQYDGQRHLKEVAGKELSIGKGRIDGASLVEAIEKRLQRLRRFRLAELLEDGSWRVDPALVETLQQKDREHPVRRIGLQRESALSLEEQAAYRGRTWLDRFTAQGKLRDAARQGFGGELNGALQRRIGLLREMGIDPMDSSRGKALDQLEKRELAAGLSRKSGATYRVLPRGGSLRGVIADTGRLPSGRRYGQLFDAKAREFTLVPWRPEFERLAGKAVELVREQQAGRYVVRQLERGLGR